MKRGEEMVPFLAHVRRCDVCRRWTRDPCAIGRRLFDEGAYTLARRIDPKRAKA